MFEQMTLAQLRKECKREHVVVNAYDSRDTLALKLMNPGNFRVLPPPPADMDQPKPAKAPKVPKTSKGKSKALPTPPPPPPDDKPAKASDKWDIVGKRVLNGKDGKPKAYILKESDGTSVRYKVGGYFVLLKRNKQDRVQKSWVKTTQKTAKGIEEAYYVPHKADLVLTEDELKAIPKAL